MPTGIFQSASDDGEVVSTMLTLTWILRKTKGIAAKGRVWDGLILPQIMQEYCI